MQATAAYIRTLTELKPGALGLLRSHAGSGLDESVEGFDLFAGIWWPLRQKNQFAPKRKVAWLIAKLYAFKPVMHLDGADFACQLRKCEPKGDNRKRFRDKFDELLLLPLNDIEPLLQWALNEIASNNLKLDWVKLTDDLSIWERKSKRLEWARNYLYKTEREENAD